MKKKTEKWKMDKNWQISSPRNFFSIADTRFFAKKEDTNIVIGFVGSSVDIHWDSKKDRDGVFNFFIKCKTSYAKACKEHSDHHHNMMEAQLATQKRIINSHIGTVK